MPENAWKPGHKKKGLPKRFFNLNFPRSSFLYKDNFPRSSYCLIKCTLCEERGKLNLYMKEERGKLFQRTSFIAH